MTVDAPVAVRRKLWPKSLGGKALVVFFAAVVLLVCLWFAAFAVAQTRFNRALAKARTFGYVENPSEPTDVSEDDNLATYLSRASKSSRKILDDAEAAERREKRKPKLGESQLHPGWSKLLESAEYESLLQQADLPSVKMKFVDPARPEVNLQDLEWFVNVEQLLGQVRLLQGLPDEAGRRIVRCLRLIRKCDSSEAEMIVHQVAGGCRKNCYSILNEVIRSTKVSPPVREEIEMELAKHDELAKEAITALKNAWAQDEAYFAKRYYCYQNGLLSPLRLLDQAQRQEAFNAYVDGVDEPYSALLNNCRKEHPLAGLPRSKWIPNESQYPRALNLQSTFDEMVARARCLRIVNAMGRKNDWNADLDSLGLPPKCLIDPMNGERLRVKPTPEGPIVYSVAGDLKDDGGMIESRKAPYDVGYGPVRTAGKK